MWYDVSCIGVGSEGSRPGPIRSHLESAPIARGWSSNVPEKYAIVGTGRLITKYIEQRDKLQEDQLTEHKLKETLGNEFIGYVKGPLLSYKCPGCSATI